MPSETERAVQDPIRQNIETILRLEQAALRKRTRADKIADGIAEFTGTIWFVVLHLTWFGVWVVVNMGLVPFVPRFDPYPFQLLCMIVSLEGVLLATFVLIKQNRMGYLSDRREHLDLQVNLLAEREVTRILRMSVQIANQLGIPHAEVSHELAQDTQVETLMETLDSKLMGDS